ncbi:MAG: hypothetical protein PVH68_14770 [Armatimonadota bacterium]
MISVFAPWWACLLLLWAGSTVGWILCAVMNAAHRADRATGDEWSELRPLKSTRQAIFSQN